MLFYIIIYSFAAGTALLPLGIAALRHYGRLVGTAGSVLLPAIAGGLFAISFYLPNIHISPETSTFQQHFVGGGIYSALLYYYIRPLIVNKKINWVTDWLLLFGWVSALGVFNKLAEFALLKAGVLQFDTTDAYWDLLANTLGAFAVYLLFILIGYFHKPDRLTTG